MSNTLRFWTQNFSSLIILHLMLLILKLLVSSCHYCNEFVSLFGTISSLLLFPVESSKVGFGWCCGIKCGHKHSGDTTWWPSKPAKWCGEKLLCIKSFISKKTSIYPSTNPDFTIYFMQHPIKSHLLAEPNNCSSSDWLTSLHLNCVSRM